MVSKRHPTAYDEHEGSRKCHTKLLLRENTLDHTQTKTWNSRISAIITCFFSEHNPIIYESACVPRTAEARDGILLFGDRFVVNLEYFGDVFKSAVEWTSFPTPISIHWDLRSRNRIWYFSPCVKTMVCHPNGMNLQKKFDDPGVCWYLEIY